ncbi:MAG: IS1634 family transposase [Bacteroidota bacterium]
MESVCPKEKNKSGSVSIQIIDKSGGKFQIVKVVGCAKNADQQRALVQQAYDLLSQLTLQPRLDFSFSEDELFFTQLQHSLQKVVVIGPELILGNLFDQIGYDEIPGNLFRHLVITRLVYPGSKLKTVDYLLQYKGTYTNKDKIYRYMDQFHLKYKEKVIALTFEHTRQILNNQISVAFYDITTLYFEASEEDDLRKLGFSKDGKAQNPQILLALLVGTDGQPLAYEVFEGNKFEGHTLIPVVEAFKEKYQLPSLIIVADAGLLSLDNIAELIRLNYPFILGARIKNEPSAIKEQIVSHTYTDNTAITLHKKDNIRLIVHYSVKRAKKDAHQRKQGLQRLEKAVKTGKLTKEKINNRGYNKYLKLKNQIAVEIDYAAFKADNQWNGLKGYATNCDLPEAEVMANYKHLWTIEKAFRISKTDLRIRPIYHRLDRRIKTHICLAFCSYKLYKELERQLNLKELPYSTGQVLNCLKTIYQAQVILPHSKKKKQLFLPLDEIQTSVVQAFGLKP